MKKQIGNFDLKVDFMLTKGANSGIKYFMENGVTMEYQILDDGNNSEAKRETHSLADLYDLKVAENKLVNPVGKWNQARIIAKGKHVEHWLNGIKVLDYDRDSEDFRSRVAKSKYRKHKGFGQNDSGFIHLQDHSDTVHYRNIKIRALK